MWYGLALLGLQIIICVVSFLIGYSFAQRLLTKQHVKDLNELNELYNYSIKDNSDEE